MSEAPLYLATLLLVVVAPESTKDARRRRASRVIPESGRRSAPCAPAARARPRHPESRTPGRRGARRSVRPCGAAPRLDCACSSLSNSASLSASGPCTGAPLVVVHVTVSRAASLVRRGSGAPHPRSGGLPVVVVSVLSATPRRRRGGKQGDDDDGKAPLTKLTTTRSAATATY